jgi:hypothetical protein
MGQPAVERLRDFLRELKPAARALLIAELERTTLRGDDMAGSELILTELRRSIRDNGTKTPRIGDHARLFFQPLEPFLVDDAVDHKHRGRIARAALEPIWLWLSNTVMPKETAALAEAVERALLAGASDQAARAADAFQTQAAERMQAAVDRVGHDEKSQRRFAVQLGSMRAREDIETVIGVLRGRDSLALLGTQLPGYIKTLAGPSLENVKAQIDSVLATKPNVIVYALVLAMTRLGASWQLVRLAVRAAGSDVATRVAETPYGAAIPIVLAELERMARELAADLKSGRGIAVSAMLKNVYDAVRGLRTELDLPAESAWGRQLAAIRADISRLLSAEIELVVGRTRRLLRPRSGKEIAPNSTIDESEAAEVETLIGFVVACRNYASELAVNEITQRTFAELQQLLDTGTRPLMDALRTASDGERSFRRSQVEAAVRFCGKAFGQEYAALLSKAAEVAAQGNERKALRA